MTAAVTPIESTETLSERKQLETNLRQIGLPVVDQAIVTAHMQSMQLDNQEATLLGRMIGQALSWISFIRVGQIVTNYRTATGASMIAFLCVIAVVTTVKYLQLDTGITGWLTFAYIFASLYALLGMQHWFDYDDIAEFESDTGITVPPRIRSRIITLDQNGIRWTLKKLGSDPLLCPYTGTWIFKTESCAGGWDTTNPAIDNA